MLASKKVFCAVDLSPGAQEPIRQAAQLAGALQGELIVFHAIPNPPAVPLELMVTPAVVPQDEIMNARQALEEQVRQLVPGGTVRVQVDEAHGPVYAAVVQAAETAGAGLVVVGRNQMSRLEHLVLGSVSEKVTRYAHGPVLVARPSPQGGQVLVAVDFSEASLAALHLAAEEAQRRDVALSLVHCLGLSPQMAGLGGGATMVPLPAEHPRSRPAMQRAAEEKLRALLSRAGIRAEVLVEEGEADVEVARLAEELDAALVVVGATGKTGLQRVLLGSVAESIVRKVPCSVLTVREGHGLTAGKRPDETTARADLGGAPR
jgi:nucleotide-binding universal stress UspA family protein